MCPFLKGLVKLKRFFLRVGRSGIAVSDRLPFLIGPVQTPVVGRLAVSVRLGCRRRGTLRSFLPEAIAPYTFLREVPLTARPLRTNPEEDRFGLTGPFRKGHIDRQHLRLRDRCGISPNPFIVGRVVWRRRRVVPRRMLPGVAEGSREDRGKR